MIDNLPEIKEIKKFVCPFCFKDHNSYDQANFCRENCFKSTEATLLLKSGETLGQINEKLKLWTNLPEYLKNVTKNNCFVLSYLQHCDHPAYRIYAINNQMKLSLWGTGGWNGRYGCDLTIDDCALKEPKPKNKLYIYGNRK